MRECILSIKRVWHYWREIFKGAKDGHEMVVNFVMGLSAILGFLGYTQNFKIIITAISASTAVILFGRAIFWLPVVRDKELNGQLEAEKTRSADESKAVIKASEDEKRALEAKIEFFHGHALEIVGISAEFGAGNDQPCQIRILNKSPSVTADNVKVELLAIRDALTDGQEAYYHPPLPFLLKPERQGESSINPGAALIFNLCYVGKVVGYASAESDEHKRNPQGFVVYFTSKHDDPKRITLGNSAHFNWDTYYRIKLIATARNFLKTEEELNLRFSEEDSCCRFGLTNV